MSILRSQVLNFVNNHLIDYPSPTNLSYIWSLGSLAGIALVIQIITGVFLAMHYVANITLAFDSCEHITRDVNYGWLLRSAHANGAFFFLYVLYLHIAKGFYYTSYSHPRQLLWSSGVAIFLLTMGAAFLGYTLPWGQMSFWGAAVITNLASAIPVVGNQIVYWLWGGFSVDNATLNRFFAFHFLIPFIIAGLALVHLYLLHTYGSSNPLGINNKMDSIPFYSYFYVKDLFGLLSYLFIYGIFVFLYPDILGHTDNYMPANPMVTPAHIVPENYFLPFYAILSSIPDKLGGVVAMVSAILIWAVLPLYSKAPIRSSSFRPIYQIVIWFLFVVFLLLGWLGQCPVEDPYITMGQIFTFLYFAVFLILIPFAEWIESRMFLTKTV